ncbi:MAG: polyprenyl synthetase family protein [Chthoniobacterales bacterium]
MKLPTSRAACSISPQPSDIFVTFMDLLEDPMSTIEERLRQQGSSFESGVEKYISYACDSSGKRLRPILALLAGGATGNISSEHSDLALIVELIHIASLIHDDIMDGAVVRRDRPTLNATWGNGLTVLAGDILFAHALRLATRFSQSEICRRIADAAIGVCSGEMLQTERRFDLSLTLENYYRIVEMKTGSLFAVACELGAVLNEASPEVVSALKEYGNKVGTAYQLLDDCIDLLGDEATFGKTLGTDLSGGKFTLPILMLLKAASHEEHNALIKDLVTDAGVNREALVKALLEQETFDAAVAEINQLLEQAEVALEVLPENDYVSGLRGMVIYLRGLAVSKISSFLNCSR